MITKRDNGSSTKRGPGRIHVEGVKRARKPKGSTGPFAGQHTNPAKNAQRDAKAVMGARQYRKQRKALAMAAREAA